MIRRLAFLTFLLSIIAWSSAQDTSALINEALDKLVKLQFEDNVVLPEAMKGISDTTGVPIEADPDVWELLPWGEQTTIKATIENQTLREALAAITRTLGLTFEVRDEFVQIQPMPALRRLGRRSTVDELSALNLLAGTPIALQSEQPTVKQLVAAIDQQLMDLKSPYAVEFRAGDTVATGSSVYVPRGATIMDALEALAKDTAATWYPWGKSIVIVPKVDQVRNQLARTLTLRYNDADVSQVLMELSQRSGVNFTIEPGAVQRISPEFRRVRLVLDNASVQQALEHIAGFTGLAYVVRDDGVHLWNPSNQPAGAARDPAVGIVTLDNGMQIIVKESQVPQDMREYLKSRTQRELDKIRAMMDEEGFVPTTRPATAPAAEDL